ncbi:flocculation suppression protein [Paracoccidioides lutzii Pb01]|uniref:Flocculation suppression protein n=1 Tax=Paracoccidioides lutzii (strain ATCC MYA-826 / Pb01) TaxID=502779 RepID=C1GSG4_PARBA|nr:flocculation suppression protein [Paracoccidioides lutzii Pb01]EEH38997.2 flocculation suppression protein [Paracoccidioides lutzii Pb01]
MNRIEEPPSRSPFSGPTDVSNKSRTIPVLSSSIAPSDHPQGDPMDLSPSSPATMAPPGNNNSDSPETEHAGGASNNNTNNNANSNTVNHSTNGAAPASTTIGGDSGHALNQPIGAAAAAQQPKVVQTAFIHKLYSMLQDPGIQHLISWSSTNESFVMSPSQDFAKVLAQYFKHTNVSSFVRQLNMYGFHKVSDVFHTGSPDSQMWEFKHGNGNFKKGDVAGLREIRRRASRQTLIHRDSFSGHKPNASQPGTPAEPTPDSSDSRVIDSRLLNTEHNVFELYSRLSRVEENYSMLASRCQALTESLVRCHQWSNSMSHFVMSLVPDPENAIHRDAANMQREVSRQLDAIRSLENPHESLLSGRQPYFGSMTLHSGPPLSPRQMPQDDNRRPSMAQPPVPVHLSVSPRRYGSIGAANSSPDYNRPQISTQYSATTATHQLHPLSAVSSPSGPNLGRRHTSADIREHWASTTTNNTYPLGSINPNPPSSSSQWPPSPQRTGPPNNPVHIPMSMSMNMNMNPVPNAGDHQHVRDVLAKYEMGGPRRQDSSRHPTPPLPPIAVDPVAANTNTNNNNTATTTPPHAPPHTSSSSSSTLNPESGWSIGGPKFPRPTDSSLPATRRSSMASNVHSLLNPTATAERLDEDDGAGEDRKRKRLQ